MSKTDSLKDKTILLVITGGIAAYKSLELIRLLKKAGADVHAILTKGGEQFVTPLSVSALCEHEVHTNLWSLKDESEMGHIRLSREADLIIVAPATANIIGQMANGLAMDLASTCLLAADKPVLMAPAMNHAMWNNPATQDNISRLQARGIKLIGPCEGDMACNEYGIGRMAEPEDILKSAASFFFDKPLKGRKALVTAGPTYEALDPVRFIGNRSSGKQGYAIASALAEAGADVTLISGPTALPDPSGVNTIRIESASEMWQACEPALNAADAPIDIAICTAAVSDWRAEKPADHKMKKRDNGDAPALNLMQNPDILKAICGHKNRPKLIIGFAAETEKLLDNAKEKLDSKGCDWVLTNNVGRDASGQEKAFGQEENHVYLVNSLGYEDWGKAPKTAIAIRLTKTIIKTLKAIKSKE